MHVVHVVKRFGPVGGMERYVWELVHALADLDLTITVLCEKAHEQPDPKIQVIELGETRPKPRWISMLRFSGRVTRYAKKMGWDRDPQTIIHSHERTAVHSVTTFHGPPMAPIKRQKLWWLSPRLITWLWLEKRELTSPGVTVLPNSIQIQKQLQAEYSGVTYGPIAWPGVTGPLPKSDTPASDVVFVGHEYVRKGLDRLIEAMECLREDQPLTLSVVGAKQDSGLDTLMKDRPWILNQPWVEHINPSEWGRVLVHPARQEPYGMVIAEAVASGIPVVATDNCGACDHFDQVRKIGANGTARQIAELIRVALKEDPPVGSECWTWKELADVHGAVYNEI